MYGDGSERGIAFCNLLKCPRCLAGNTLVLATNPVICAKCGASFCTPGGILDFVAGRDNTALDIIGYDQEKNVSMETSLELFQHLQRVSGDLVPGALGNTLEIGAGTGLLTLGMLALNDFDSAIITDISLEMLEVCRARLQKYLNSEKRSRVFLTTYSGREDIFADGAYDLCIGNSVVHHILDYRAFFANVRRTLKPTGTAIFIEPSGPFHVALTLSMNDTLVAMIAEGGGLVDCDVRLLARWLAEARSGLIFPEADKSTREDKHVFWREDLEVAARSAGFACSTILPWHYDPVGLVTLNNYLRGIGVSHESSERFFPVFAEIAGHHFRYLPEPDKSSMYVISFHCVGDAKAS